jgi:hypothetical protein
MLDFLTCLAIVAGVGAAVWLLDTVLTRVRLKARDNDLDED